MSKNRPRPIAIVARRCQRVIGRRFMRAATVGLGDVGSGAGAGVGTTGSLRPAVMAVPPRIDLMCRRSGHRIRCSVPRRCLDTHHRRHPSLLQNAISTVQLADIEMAAIAENASSSRPKTSSFSDRYIDRTPRPHGQYVCCAAGHGAAERQIQPRTATPYRLGVPTPYGVPASTMITWRAGLGVRETVVLRKRARVEVSDVGRSRTVRLRGRGGRA